MKRIFFLLPFILIFAGCSTLKIESNKSPEFNDKIERLYVTMNGAAESEKFYELFYLDFKAQLDIKNIPAQAHYFNTLALESEEEIDSKIKSWNPNLLMVINQTESRGVVNDYIFSKQITRTGGTFDIKLFLPNMKTPVWRASIAVDNETGLVSAAHKSSTKLIEKLIEDGILN